MSANKIPEPSRPTGPPVQSRILGRLLAKPTFQPMGAQGVLLAGGWSAFRNKMQQWALLEQDMRRPFLFVPVAMMAGVLLYVKADQEPHWLAPFALLLVAAWLAWLNRDQRRGVMAGLVLVCAVAAGFLAACLQTLRVSAPVLQAPWMGYGSGLIEQIDWGQDGAGEDNAHVILRVYKLGALDAHQRPLKLKLSLKGRPVIQAGDVIYAPMRVQPLPGPSYAGGYDFRSDYFFKQVGGVGSIVGPIKQGYGRPPNAWQKIWAGLDRYRCLVTERIVRVIGGQNGAVAAALITGKRGYINDHSNDVLRSAGIYHVVSISGLHMAIAAGFAFTCARLLFLMVPGLSLRHDTRRWAAWSGMAGAVVYDIFAGSDIATERSMLMTLVLFGAIAFGRRLLSMRNCALAAILLVMVEPNGVLNPGFQMSFAAVAGLIALYERKPVHRHPAIQGMHGPQALTDQQGKAASVPFYKHPKLKGIFHEVVLTTLVAEAATAPFGLYHFHMIQSYGLVGNAITLPFVSFIVMPAAGIGLLAMPFGLDAPVWTLMGMGIEAMMRCCEWIAAWPVATRYMAGFSVVALLWMVLGFTILCLLISPLRFAAVPFLCVGIILASQTDRPEFYVSRDGRSVAVRMQDGRLKFAGLGLNHFTLSQIARQDGDDRLSSDPSLLAAEACEKKDCRLTSASGLKIALVWNEALLPQACLQADVVVTRLHTQQTCQAILIDALFLQQRGAVQGVIRSGQLVVVTDHTPLRDRPWAPVVESKERAPQKK
jgi:competence protein ComEC